MAYCKALKHDMSFDSKLLAALRTRSLESKKMIREGSNDDSAKESELRSFARRVRPVLRVRFARMCACLLYTSDAADE